MPGTPDDRAGGITDAGKMILRDEGLTLDYPGEAIYDDVAGEFALRDAAGVFDPRAGGALPTPDEAGQILFAPTAAAFVAARPLINSDAIILSNLDAIMVTT